ncbi:unnamed protein product [Sphenostylis stenocarpa]|uniref:Uncharacterized protein n=1 Tax=Sphenostylis stenocarpa TaxID=92480 RepID=A0AA86VNM2_9FABA|nr:unnamed protein product [Sphenostylis stenocarpa]
MVDIQCLPYFLVSLRLEGDPLSSLNRSNHGYDFLHFEYGILEKMLLQLGRSQGSFLLFRAMMPLRHSKTTRVLLKSIQLLDLRRSLVVFNKTFNAIAFNLQCDVESNEFRNFEKIQ